MVKELRPLCPDAVRSGWSTNLLNSYNRQNTLESLRNGFQSPSHVDLPTANQHDANGKWYKSWTDVKHILENKGPLSIVVVGSDDEWTCRILVRMFLVTYAREILLNDDTPMTDDTGFVFHSITLADKTVEYDMSIPCLLYTSPSPRDLSTSRMPSSA